MLHCQKCFRVGHCLQKTVPIVNDVEIGDPEFVRVARNFLASLPVTDSEWLEHAHNLNRDLTITIIEGANWRIDLDMSPLEIDYDDEDLIEACPAEKRLRLWFRDIIKPVPADTNPRVRLEAKERFRILATLIIAHNPQIDWPRTVPANDNVCAVNDNFPEKRSYPPNPHGCGCR